MSVSLYFKFLCIFYLLVKSKVHIKKAAFHVHGRDVSRVFVVGPVM